MFVFYHKVMKSKIISFLATVLIFGNSVFFAYTQSDEGKSESESEEKVSVKDVALAAGVAFTVNVFFNWADRIILDEDYAAVNLRTIKKNLTSAWWWDIDNFETNQFGHPYQGSLYFNAGRANGLNFWQSLVIAGFGSLTWEECGETDSPSINDIITTPMCGAIFGESFHRLYIDAAELCPAFAWLLSPMDGLNRVLTGKNLKASGHTEEIDLLFHGGTECSKTDFSDSSDSDGLKKFAGGGAIHIQYGEAIAHATKEPFDLFTVDVDTAFSAYFYKVDFDIDGFLWSTPLYFEESEATFGVNLMYEGEWASNAVFSNAATGVKFLYESRFFDSDGRFSFFAQIDGIFMGTRSIYSLYKNRADYEDWEEPPRFYNFGGGVLAKFGFSLEDSRLGTFYAETSADFLMPFTGSQVGQVKAEKNFMAKAKIGYEHKITDGFSLGLSDSLSYKADWYKNQSDVAQIMNSAQLYGKVAFKRK